MTTPRTERRGRSRADSSQGPSEKTVNIRRVSKVVKGGRRLSFSALVAVGDGNGKVGVGLGKASTIPDAVRKASTTAQKEMVKVELRNTSIPHVVKAKYGAAMVLMKPAPVGTGIIAGPSIRAVLEMSGIKDIVTKSLGSQNPINVARATIQALGQLQKAHGQQPTPKIESPMTDTK
jgi:small subunit ribosomal protein S5